MRSNIFLSLCRRVAVVASLACCNSVYAVTTITADDIAVAAGETVVMDGPDLDLGTASITISGVDGFAYDVDFVGSPNNLGFNPFETNTAPSTIGVLGAGQTGEIGAGESLTINFNSLATVSGLTFGRQGSNDNELLISGFLADPGATFAPTNAAETDVFDISFDSGVLTVDSGGNGFVYEYDLVFANPVQATSLLIEAPNSSGGVGFTAVEFTPGLQFMPGDVDGDGMVEPATVGNLGDDLGPIIANFFTEQNTRAAGDIAAPFGFVDFADFRQWKDNVPGGSNLELAQLLSAPEPTSLVMLSTVAAMLAARGRTRAC